MKKQQIWTENLSLTTSVVLGSAMLAGMFWAMNSCGNKADGQWKSYARESQEAYDAPQRKLAEQMREEVQKERDKWEYQRQARETIRQGRLDELRKKSTAALAKEVTPLLRGDREKFCAAYPYLTVLLERDKDKSAESLVATIRAKEKKEMRDDQEGVTKKFCLCANGEVTPVREWGRGKGGCCGGGVYGPKIADVPHPRDRADCRGRDNAQLPYGPLRAPSTTPGGQPAPAQGELTSRSSKLSAPAHAGALCFVGVVRTLAPCAFSSPSPYCSSPAPTTPSLPRSAPQASRSPAPVLEEGRAPRSATQRAPPTGPVPPAT